MKEENKSSREEFKRLKYYLPLIEEGLETEFKLWDALSDEALISFENKLVKINYMV